MNKKGIPRKINIFKDLKKDDDDNNNIEREMYSRYSVLSQKSSIKMKQKNTRGPHARINHLYTATAKNIFHEKSSNNPL